MASRANTELQAPVAGRAEKRVKYTTVGLVMAIAVGASTVALAQAADAPPGGDAAPESAAQPAGQRGRFARFFDPQDGQLDLSELLEDPRGFLPIPLDRDGARSRLRRRRHRDVPAAAQEAGDEGWARPDISAVGGFATENGTWGALAGDSSRWLDGRLKTLVGGGTGRVNLDFYGLGVDQSTLNEAIRYSLQLLRRGRASQLAARARSRRGRSACVTSTPTSSRRCARIRCSPTSPTRSASRSPRRPPSSSTTAATTCSRPRAESTRRRRTWRRARRSAPRDDFERFEQVLIGW